MGLWIRANSDAWEAIETGSPELTEKVLQECEYVDFLFRDHSFALNMHAQALVGAIERAQTQTERDYFAQRGRQLVEKFDKYPNAVWGDWPRWLFYRAVGDEQKAAAAIRRVGRDPTTYCWFLAADCLGRRDAQAALDEFTQTIAPEHRTDKYVRLAESRLVCNLEKSADRVRELAEDLLDDPSPLIRRNALYSLYIACPEAGLQYAARAASVRSPESEASFDPFGEEVMEKYLAGQVPADDLLEKAASHRYFLANAHFTIGIVCLATGKQRDAREHLGKAVTPRAFESFDYAWAKAYLIRMDADPDWATSIRAKRGK